jgi:hypothetical protein
MRLFPFHATHAVRAGEFENYSYDDLLALVHDHINGRFEVAFDQWTEPAALGAYACEIRSQGGSLAGISTEFNHVPRWVVLAWLIEHRVTEHADCHWCWQRWWGWRALSRLAGHQTRPRSPFDPIDFHIVTKGNTNV